MSKKLKQLSNETIIECQAPKAQAVFVAGSFNEWSTTGTPLRREANGHWAVRLALPPGHHEFKFLVDGRWCCDPGCDGPHTGCPGCVGNPFGTMNRVVEVGGVT